MLGVIRLIDGLLEWLGVLAYASHCWFWFAHYANAP